MARAAVHRGRRSSPARPLGLSLPKQKMVPGLALRLAAAERLQLVLKGASFAPLAAADVSDARDRALANKLITTALRHHGHLSLMLNHLLDKGMPKKSGSFEAVARLSLAQLLFLPEIGDHSALFLAGEALKRDKNAAHLAKLLNAVLRRAQTEAAELRQGPPELLFAPALVKTWTAAYGADIIPAFAQALLDGAPLDVTLKADYPALLELLGARPILADTVRIDQRDKPVDQLPGFAEGRFWVQDAAAAIPARLLNLAPGARVLDIGASPGGKTAQLIKAGYTVTALERDPSRMERLRGNLHRLSYTAELVTADALDYVPASRFDGVLLDAPCSATGTFRRHPEVVWHRNPADIAGRVALQRQLISKGVDCLNPGGVLIYCVCSLEPEEGEAQARWAAEQGLELLPVAAGELNGWAVPVTETGYIRTHPGQIVPGEKGGTLDGFFVARFRRA
ncbi:MAG: MFS transporter [Hyphomicrobiales bacterium]|nr:MAG: MFS transporter [Hyphomicrobiales bacterium]